jgi:hypothetical protein
MKQQIILNISEVDIEIPIKIAKDAIKDLR